MAKNLFASAPNVGQCFQPALPELAPASCGADTPVCDPEPAPSSIRAHSRSFAVKNHPAAGGAQC